MKKLTLLSTAGIGVLLNFTSLTVHSHPKQQKNQDEEVITLDTVEVKGRATDLLGIASSASQGMVGQPEFKYRPLSRVGELVEVVPGTLATQHSGSGKANQFFLRGFNLDHGTDFSVSVDGVPMNMPSHAHGQGYLDLNSIIPELVDKVEYGKGPYYADVGDFASAGYAQMHTFHKMDKAFIKFTGGEYDYYRVVAANSHKIGAGDLLYGGEFNTYNGVWQQPEDLGKFNGMVRYTLTEKDWGAAVNAKAYHSSWNATNQIPRTAVDSGEIGLYGTGDNTDGGKSNRYSLSGNFWSKGTGYKNEFNAYAVYSDLDLYSNFSGYLENPERGDQLNQKEHRLIFGGNGEQTWFNKVLGFEMDNTIGLQVRHDRINGLALNHSEAKQVFNTVREDNVNQTSVGLYAKNQTRWLEKFRTVSGLRADFYHFDVASKTLPVNSGDKTAALVSPKLSMIFGPWADSEVFINLGYGFHSNDARGITLNADPVSGNPSASAISLVRSRGAELGFRSQFIPGLNSTLALWWLQLNSELVFVGDAGTTEPTGKSERYGIEWNNYYKPTDWLTLDADFAFSKANYTGVPNNQSYVPNSVHHVISAGAVVNLPYNLFATARIRHFGDVPLNEDNTANAGDTTLLNIGAGYEIERVKLEVDVFNLLGSKANDIAYYYNYRTKNNPNPNGVQDIIFHPVEPRMVRGSITVKF
jgi:hypothetical protein